MEVGRDPPPLVLLGREEPVEQQAPAFVEPLDGPHEAEPDQRPEDGREHRTVDHRGDQRRRSPGNDSGEHRHDPELQGEHRRQEDDEEAAGTAAAGVAMPGLRPQAHDRLLRGTMSACRSGRLRTPLATRPSLTAYPRGRTRQSHLATSVR